MSIDLHLYLFVWLMCGAFTALLYNRMTGDMNNKIMLVALFLGPLTVLISIIIAIGRGIRGQ